MTGQPEAETNGGAHDLARLLHHYDPAQVWYQLEEIVGDRTYLRHGIQVREGDVVLDVGANVGVAALFFALECGAGRVHSFEPVAPLFELLRPNTRAFSRLRTACLWAGIQPRLGADHVLPEGRFDVEPLPGSRR